MLKVTDLMFDCSTWDDATGENFVGMTGIMFDSAINEVDKNGNVIKCIAVGRSMEEALNQELAEACGTDLNSIEEDIYDLTKNPDPKINVEYIKRAYKRGYPLL